MIFLPSIFLPHSFVATYPRFCFSAKAVQQNLRNLHELKCYAAALSYILSTLLHQEMQSRRKYIKLEDLDQEKHPACVPPCWNEFFIGCREPQ